MTESAAQPAAPKPGRSLTGFYIGLGIVAALVGLGVILLPYLRLQYAIHQVRSATRERYQGGAEWVDMVSDAAQRGNGDAIDALIMYQKQDLSGPIWLWQVATGPADVRAVFYRQLDRWPDADVLMALEGIARYIGNDLSMSDDIEEYHYNDSADPKGLVANMEPPAQKATDPKIRDAAQDLVAFVRRRFAKELADRKTQGGNAAKQP